MSKILSIPVGRETILLDLDSEAANDEDLRNYELWRAQTYSTKEPDTLAWIDEFFRAGDVLYDIGANIGQYSLYAAKRLKGVCQVLAFEPEALNYAKLNRNIVLNGLVGVIVPYCLAISGQTALDRFYVKAFTPGAALHSLHRPLTQGDEPFAPQNQQGTLAVSLDDLTGRFAAPAPNHIKIDVDGIEAQIVRGAAQTLRSPALRTVLVEVYMYKTVAEEVRFAFESAGFRLHNAAAVTYKPGTAQNLIFTR